MTRIAHIRTWTYITHPATGSMAPPIGRSAPAASRTGCPTRCTTASPSALSIAARRSWCAIWPATRELLASVGKDGEVRVEGTYVGRLDGFRFIPDATDERRERTLATAANRVLRSEIGSAGRRLPPTRTRPSRSMSLAVCCGAAGRLAGWSPAMAC